MKLHQLMALVLILAPLPSCFSQPENKKIDVEPLNRYLLEGKVQDAILWASENCLSKEVRSPEAIRCVLTTSKAWRYSLNLPKAKQVLEKVDANGLSEDLLREFLFEKALVEFENGQVLKSRQTFRELEAKTRPGDKLYSAVKITGIYIRAGDMTPKEKLKVIAEVEEAWKNQLSTDQQSLLAWIHLSKARIYRRQKTFSKALKEVETAMQLAEQKSPDLGVDRLKILFEKIAILYSLQNSKEKLEVLSKTEEYLKTLQLPEAYLQVVQLFRLEDQTFRSKMATRALNPNPGPNHYLSEILTSIKKSGARPIPNERAERRQVQKEETRR